MQLDGSILARKTIRLAWHGFKKQQPCIVRQTSGSMQNLNACGSLHFLQAEGPHRELRARAWGVMMVMMTVMMMMVS